MEHLVTLLPEMTPLLEVALSHSSAIGSAEGAKIEKPEQLAVWATYGSLVVQLLSRRASMGRIGCSEIWAADSAARGIARHLRDRCSAALRASGRVIYGRSLKETERVSPSVQDALVNQYVGAITELYGLARTTRLFLELGDASRMEVLASKDSKTVLNEYLGRYRMPNAVYEHERPSGPRHQPIFNCLIRLSDGRSTRGVGASKRHAELDAANNLIRKYRLPIREHHLVVQTAPASKALASAIPRLANMEFAQQIVSEFGLPEWAASMVALAHVHASHSGKGGPLGKDQRFLAWLGSAAYEWAIADIVVRECAAALPLTAELLVRLVRGATAESIAIWPARLSRQVDRNLLRGPGERMPTASILKQADQAFVGALFLARGEECSGGAHLLSSKELPPARVVAEFVTEVVSRDRVGLVASLEKGQLGFDLDELEEMVEHALQVVWTCQFCDEDHTEELPVNGECRNCGTVVLSSRSSESAEGPRASMGGTPAVPVEGRAAMSPQRPSLCPGCGSVNPSTGGDASQCLKCGFLRVLSGSGARVHVRASRPRVADVPPVAKADSRGLKEEPAARPKEPSGRPATRQSPARLSAFPLFCPFCDAFHPNSYSEDSNCRECGTRGLRRRPRSPRIQRPGDQSAPRWFVPVASADARRVAGLLDHNFGIPYRLQARLLRESGSQAVLVFQWTCYVEKPTLPSVFVARIPFDPEWIDDGATDAIVKVKPTLRDLLPDSTAKYFQCGVATPRDEVIVALGPTFVRSQAGAPRPRLVGICPMMALWTRYAEESSEDARDALAALHSDP